MTLYGFSLKTTTFVCKHFESMRVLIINTSERIGGAAVAAGRLMESLKNNGIKAKMLVRDKQTDQISVVGLKRSWLHVWKFMWERIVIWKANRFKKNDLFAVDIANTGTDITSLPEFQQADVIHLHWINQGMLSLNTIRKILASGKPVVWTMHDMWPCTGICHYARECRNYEQECHHCPYHLRRRRQEGLIYPNLPEEERNLYSSGIHSFRHAAAIGWRNKAKPADCLKEKRLSVSRTPSTRICSSLTK